MVPEVDRVAGEGGPGGPGGGPRPQQVDLDPLVGLNDARMPLRSKLLAVPSLNARYLEHVRTIAGEGWTGGARADRGPVPRR